MITLTVNGILHRLDIDPQTPLLWVLREHLNLTGTKFGCGIAQCGACTVHLNDAPVRACVLPLAAVAGAAVTTIEGLTSVLDAAEPLATLHPVQRAWVEEQVPQCGYCQSGQIMSAVALLATNPAPDDAAIDAALRGNLCRCGTYPRIRRAVHRAAALVRNGGTPAVGIHDPAEVRS
jgi:isoquinoline 1-oxidoreductase alpha subunit